MRRLLRGFAVAVVFVAASVLLESFTPQDPPKPTPPPAAQVTPTPTPTAKPPAVPDIPEVTRLKLEKALLSANLAQKTAQLAQKTYEQTMAELGAQMTKLISDFEHEFPGFSIDAQTLKAIPKKAAGK